MALKELVDMGYNLWMEIPNIERIYPEYTKIYGPYKSSADQRLRLVLYNPLTKVKTTKLLSRVLLECHIGRQLTGSETVDHIDGNRLNDCVCNLQVLDRAANARKSSLGNRYCAGIKQKEESKRSGSKNGQAKLTDAEVVALRTEFADNSAVRYYCEKYKISRRTVENILSGKSYVKSGGPIYRLRPGRKSDTASVAKLVETQGA